jgi:hypothetical protein
MDDGISDAGCRTMIEGHSLRGVRLEAQDGIAYLPPLPGPLSEEAISEALRNVGECVVAVFEDWESTAEEIISHWFPWMEFQRLTFVRKTFDKLDRSRAMEVRSEFLAVVMKMNKCDLLLYDKMRRMSKAQLEVTRSTAFRV